MKWTTIICALTAMLLAIPTAFGAADAARGVKVFGACIACHSMRPGEQLTGPSLAGVFGRRAGTEKGFVRYSEALRKASVTWDAGSLDAWLADPQKFIPGNTMTFRGLPDAGQRADLIAFLENPKAAAQAAGGRMGGMMSQARLESLRDVEPQGQVRAIRYCRDSYFVTLGTGKTFPFWEFNLRFKTDGSGTGPAPGQPVILHAGMRGDRASIVFASPDEISKFIEKHCA
jgi:cytochrome c